MTINDSSMQQEALDKINVFLDEAKKVGNYKLPTVSIIITNYNYEKYLEECIDSVLSQDYPFIQKIIVDDKSTDSSKEILKKYENEFEIIYKDKNEGQLAGFFTGLKVAYGDFVLFLDADDVLENHALSAHLAVHLFKDPQVAFTCARNRQISENSTLVSDFHSDFKTFGQEYRLVKPALLHTQTWSWSTTSAMMFRKDVLDLIETKNTEPFRICADYYIVHFANILGGSMLINKPLVNYRKHGGNNFAKNKIIGGPKPNGHLTYHSHPNHESLQKEILDKLVHERSTFEPYFSTAKEYAILMGRIKDVNTILEDYENELDEDLKVLLFYVVEQEIKNRKKNVRKRI